MPEHPIRDGAAVFDALDTVRILPLLVLDDAEPASATASALLAGGIRCAEIALRTEAAIPAIAAASRVPGFLVGAGTVLTPDQVDATVAAGARFIVSPGLDERVVVRARDLGVAVLPGVVTATEVQRALTLGLDRLKFFPAEASGGLAAITALAGPFPTVRFLPSGGVTEANAPDYLRSAAVFAVSGSWMASRDAIAARDLSAIEGAARRSAALARDPR
ncbi:bifunctional 4-hydroxy-2-oxoglutarate aldolase/2-dehydro-3-deoxy-phosphogluconate aldolase [Lysobacter korlensis]|uniref:Bifunctional 4-hydroxy-2-oxoglutarate aldolase/2-dehydro-3-deoxy-phosphogluconate aldolase n=1 Tax=Lysobacter korlensis TaxID=553636 RepID=A0ABV6RT16_9GAMM